MWKWENVTVALPILLEDAYGSLSIKYFTVTLTPTGSKSLTFLVLKPQKIGVNVYVTNETLNAI